MDTINTVLGRIDKSEINACLCHEHICCFSEYLFKMAGKEYLDKESLAEKSIAELKRLKDTYGMNLFVDCTPANIGRDIDLLKKVSKESGVHIGLDRLYGNKSDDYINKKLEIISKLCELGYVDKIILSHDELFFNGFDAEPQVKEITRFDYVFKHILRGLMPLFQIRLSEKIR